MALCLGSYRTAGQDAIGAHFILSCAHPTNLQRAGVRGRISKSASAKLKTLATLRLQERERDAVAAARAGFNDDGEAETEISKAMSQIELDLKQTRQNLHRMRISGHEWKTIKPGLREVYRQCRKRMERALW